MKVTLQLALPRDELSIPLARHVAASAMREIGVYQECIDDIGVALTEACTNVLNHSGPGDDYEVHLCVDEQECVIRVIDSGQGFDSATLSGHEPALSDESGRGIVLMRALVDHVRFESRPEEGTIVNLFKELHYVEDAPIFRFATKAGASTGTTGTARRGGDGTGGG